MQPSFLGRQKFISGRDFAILGRQTSFSGS